MLVDTHCHLDFDEFKDDLNATIERAKGAGVGYIINIGSSFKGSKKSVELASRYNLIYASLGIHPHHAEEITDGTLDEVRALAGTSDKIVAIGEVGLDYFKSPSSKASQIKLFTRFINLARELNLPLIIHNRDASGDVMDILKKEAEKPLRGVVHCFSGDKSFLKEVLDTGLFISFTCNLTFKNARALRETAKYAPAERLLLETDSPFLAPQAFRGKRNEPAYITHLADTLSEILVLSKEDVARVTTHNANTLFKLGIEEKPKIAYRIRESLYLNITNRCTDECDFCARFSSAFVKGHNLKLEKEPTVEDILAVIEKEKDIRQYKEIVFCGFGEPTLRLDVITKVSKKIKEKGKPIRLVTNGHGNLINGRSIAKELKGLIDKISVSMNVDSKEKYNRICKPRFGEGTFEEILDFIKDSRKMGFKVEITCLDLPETDIGECKALAKDLGAEFRLRKLNVVG